MDLKSEIIERCNSIKIQPKKIHYIIIKFMQIEQ